jgi:tetratricopeptide (TPR) repeat protein
MKTKIYLIIFFFNIIAISTFSQENIDLLILNRDYNNALKLIDENLSVNQSADMYFKKGLICNQIQNYSESIAAFLKAFELEPNNPDYLSELAECYATVGNFFDAETYFQQVVILQPENLSFAGKLGRNYINQKNYKKAYEIFDRIYKQDSTNFYWNKQYAFCAYQLQEMLKAADLYEKVLEANSHDYTSYFNLIKVYNQMPPTGKILVTINRGLDNFPGNAGFYEEQANHYTGNKQYKEARIAFENYFTAGGDSLFRNLLNYGVSLYFQKEEKKSIEILDICASQVANDPYVLFYLSLNYKQLSNFELSEAYMNAAIESATPSYLPDMYHHLGQILGMQRKFEESIQALKEANKLDPENPEILFEIATTFEEYNSNKTLALNYYQIYLKQAGAAARNANYALTRISKIKEDLFFNE